MSKQKKIMLLGGLRYVIPLIAAAHKHGYYVITADYLPNNVAHQYADEYVNVSKTSSTGVSMSWTAEKVGWIDIEYKDDAEEQTGRSASQLVRSFDLVEGGYDVRLEFGIETAAEYADGQQFIGQVTADITYRDSTGALDTKNNVAIVSLIADYADREGSLQKVEVEGTDVSLSEFMFKRGYTNRFQMEFDDISSLVKMKLKVVPKDADTSWKIARVSARQVFDEGSLSYNTMNEYERYYNVKAQDLTASSNAKPITVTPVSGQATVVTFNFNAGNSIKVDLEDRCTHKLQPPSCLM